MSLRRKKKF
jgi:hypothetical protein